MSGKMYEKRPEEDARYHDTWRLLKKYRDVTWSLELSIRQVKNQFRIDYDCSIEDFLESIYYNRIFENYTGEVATWYSASPSIFESDCRISPQTIFEVVYQGRLCARDGNGDFEGKIPFVPFFEFERREAIRCSKKLPNLKGYEQMKEKLLSLPGGEQYSLHGACQDHWIYALSFGKETVQVIDTSEWMGRSYELIAVLYTHKPTGFQFTNYCIRPAGIISSSSRHDLLLYDWTEHQAGADSY